MLISFFKKIIRVTHTEKLIYMLFRWCFRKKPTEAKEYLLSQSSDPATSCLCENNVCDPTVDLQIVIPVFNTERYIEACIQSVLSQKTKYLYHMVIVNDGSTDCTADILQRYASDQRITVITQENKGFSGARNTGLHNLFGKYLMFLDSDDILAENAIEALLDAAYHYHADIVEGNYYHILPDGKLRKEKERSLLVTKHAVGTLQGFAWMKVIKSELFSDVCFPPYYWFEDTIMAMVVFPKASLSVVIPEYVYGYRANPKGITAKARKRNKSIDTVWILFSLIRDIQNKGRAFSQDDYLQILRQIHLNYYRLAGLSPQINEAAFVLAADLIRSFSSDCYPIEKKRFWYRELDRTLRSNQYEAYRFICSMVSQLS